MISLKGKRALVTGGARGIGAATAKLLAQAGANVGIAYRTRDEEADLVLSSIRAEGVTGFAFRGNLAMAEANEEFVARAQEHFGGVDIFVGNSGVWPPIPNNVDTLDRKSVV